jgi:hypothetical protein
MGIPVVVWGVIKVVGIAITAYELYELGSAAAEGVAEFEGALEKAKEWVRKEMESIKETLDERIDKTAEIALLHKLESYDVERQSPVTKAARGRTFGGSREIIGAIKQTIPFRKEIGNVCALADKLPDIQLRRKDGKKLKPKDIPRSKIKILLEVLRLTAEEFDALDEIEGFTRVRLKQLVVSRLFEFMDDLLDWASPLKAEACYGEGPTFADPKMDGGTKLKRLGTSINPFWPTPQGKGSISADITIPDYRKEPLTKTNTFALIEIKFKGDKPRENQFKDYEELSKKCGKEKTKHITLPKTNGSTGVKLGCRIALFRYPEDIAVEPPDDDKDTKKPDDKGAKKTTKPSSRRGGR